jgi:hypothetical protein
VDVEPGPGDGEFEDDDDTGFDVSFIHAGLELIVLPFNGI